MIGGFGDFVFESLNVSGVGVVDLGGSYKVGDKFGADVVRVMDKNTVRFVDVEITIDVGVVLVVGSDHLVLFLGSDYLVAVDGGSNVVELVIEGDMVVVKEGYLVL